MRQGESAANGTEELEALVDADTEPAGAVVAGVVAAGPDATVGVLALVWARRLALAVATVAVDVAEVVVTGAVVLAGGAAVAFGGFLATGVAVRWRRRWTRTTWR